jgi:hypothetical protein
MLCRIIFDATALRDMWQTGLLDSLGRMGQNVFTTTRAFLASELQPDYTTDVAANFSFIRIDQPVDDEFYRIQTLQRQYPATTFSDCSVLLKALDKGYTLLTSDLTVRKIAYEIGIPAISFHTLLGNMVHSEMISLLEATEIYMQLSGSTGTLTGFAPTVQHPATLFSKKPINIIA